MILVIGRKHIIGTTTSSKHQSTNRSSQEEGVSLDGAQTLSMLSFLQELLKLVSSNNIGLLTSMMNVMSQVVPIPSSSDEPTMTGTILSVICATIFRGLSGAIPPWSIEHMPDVFSTIFRCGCQRNIETFINVLTTSFLVPAVVTVQTKALVDSSSTRPPLLAGPFISTMSKGLTEEFVTNAKEAAMKDSNDGWKRFKTSLKKICGGKKKDNQHFKGL